MLSLGHIASQLRRRRRCCALPLQALRNDDLCIREKFRTALQYGKQEAQLSLTNRPTLVCCQELPSGEWLRFIGRVFRPLHTPLPFDALSERIPSSCRVRVTRMAGLQSVEGRMVIDSVVWAQNVTMTDTQTATSL